jgi:hypothetical protein
MVGLDYQNIRLSEGGYQKIRVSGFSRYSDILMPCILISWYPDHLNLKWG